MLAQCLLNSLPKYLLKACPIACSNQHVFLLLLQTPCTWRVASFQPNTTFSCFPRHRESNTAGLIIRRPSPPNHFPLANVTEARPLSQNVTQARPLSQNVTQARPLSQKLTENRPLSEKLTENRPLSAYDLHRLEIRIRPVLVQELGSPHDGYEVFCVGEVDDVVGPAGFHPDALDAITGHFILFNFSVL